MFVRPEKINVLARVPGAFCCRVVVPAGLNACQRAPNASVGILGISPLRSQGLRPLSRGMHAGFIRLPSAERRAGSRCFGALSGAFCSLGGRRWRSVKSEVVFAGLGVRQWHAEHARGESECSVAGVLGVLSGRLVAGTRRLDARRPAVSAVAGMCQCVTASIFQPPLPKARSADSPGELLHGVFPGSLHGGRVFWALQDVAVERIVHIGVFAAVHRGYGEAAGQAGVSGGSCHRAGVASSLSRRRPMRPGGGSF